MIRVEMNTIVWSRRIICSSFQADRSTDFRLQFNGTAHILFEAVCMH